MIAHDRHRVKVHWYVLLLQVCCHRLQDGLLQRLISLLRISRELLAQIIVDEQLHRLAASVLLENTQICWWGAVQMALELQQLPPNSRPP